MAFGNANVKTFLRGKYLWWLRLTMNIARASSIDVACDWAGLEPGHVGVYAW